MAKKINNIHDKYFKAMLTEPGLAEDLLRLVLPGDVLKSIDLGTLSPQEGSFIDKNLETTFSDALFKVGSAEGSGEAYFSILLEHKSQPYEFTIFQVLSYKASGYSAQIKRNEPLGVIIPIVYYHGKSVWKIKGVKEFFAGIPPGLTNYIPEFDIIFVDLNQLSDEALLGLQNSMLSVVISLQRYSNNPMKLLKEFERIMTTISRFGSGNFFNQSFVYYCQLIDQEPEQIMQLTDNLEENLKLKVMTTYEKFIAKGKAEGKEEEKIEMIHKGLENGLSVDLLSNITGVSKERIIEIAKSISL